jgi:hypothetical protein
VFGALFGVSQQFALEFSVFGRGVPARAGSSDGAERCRPVGESDVHLRGRADQVHGFITNQVFKIKEKHIRGGIETAEVAVNFERLGGCLAREALGGHDLKDVSGSDVFFSLTNGGSVLFAGHVGTELGRGERGQRRSGEKGKRCSEGGFEFVKLFFCANGRPAGFLICDLLICDQDEFTVSMVEGDEGVGVEEDGIGQMAMGLEGNGRFEEAHSVIAEVSNQAACETRETGDALRCVGDHLGSDLGAEDVKGVGVFGEVGDFRLLTGDVRFEAASAEDIRRAWVDSDEGVPCDLFAPGDGFEEERGTVSCQFQVNGDGGFQVRGEFADGGSVGGSGNYMGSEHIDLLS